MKKKYLLRTNLLICLIILTGFFLTQMLNFISYNQLLKDDIENITKLTSSKIYEEMENVLSKPIIISETMATNTFLKSWIRNEQSNNSSKDSQQELQKYLNSIKREYGYHSVFLISEMTRTYYHYQKKPRSITKAHLRDSWYFDFIESNKDYNFLIDADEADNDALTFFLNRRILDLDDRLMGVLGIGISMDSLQLMMQSYNNDYDLQTYFIDSQGTIVFHTDRTAINTENLFQRYTSEAFKDTVLQNKTQLQMQWYPDSNVDNCVITRYLPSLSWYLVVEKDTTPLRNSFLLLLRKNIIIILLVILLTIVITSYVLIKYDQLVTKLSSSDFLTGLPNRRLFKLLYQERLHRIKPGNSWIFIFDIDKFKLINDANGHLFGDEVLVYVAAKLTEIIGKNGMTARWGGDEFVGILFATKDQTTQLLIKLKDQIAQFKKDDSLEVTISVGVTPAEPGAPLDELLKRADLALYQSKEQGRNRITFL